jgi:hypothetical protein
LKTSLSRWEKILVKSAIEQMSNVMHYFREELFHSKDILLENLIVANSQTRQNLGFVYYHEVRRTIRMITLTKKIHKRAVLGL